MVCKVLKLHQGVRLPLLEGCKESLDDSPVLSTHQPPLPQALHSQLEHRSHSACVLKLSDSMRKPGLQAAQVWLGLISLAFYRRSYKQLLQVTA